MARNSANPSDETPRDDENFISSESDADAEEIDAAWNSGTRPRRRRAVEPAEGTENSEGASDGSSGETGESGDSDSYGGSRPLRNYRSRYHRSDDEGEAPRWNRYGRRRDDESEEKDSSDENGEERQDGYLGRQRETIWNRNPFNDRNRGDYRYNRDYRGGYNDRNRDDENGEDDDQRRGGYRDQGRYRGGYQNRYRQEEGGYRERPYRQERFYRRHFRDSDVRVVRDSDLRSDAQAETEANENQNPANPAASNPSESFHTDRYRPSYGRRYTNPGYPNEMLDAMEPEHAPRGKYGEPLSLAEELASVRYRAKEDEPTPELFTPEELERLACDGMTGAEYVESLQKLEAQDLVKEARKFDAGDEAAQARRDAIFRILKEKIKVSGMMYGQGTLEILPEEFGFLRNPEYHYLSCPDDIYISPSQIRRFGLRNGSTVFGQIRPPKEKERYFALLRIEAINDEDPNLLLNKPMFDDLTAMHPNERIVLETNDGEMDTRVVDIVVPVGFGQRGLIVSPPRAGKTILMQKMARSVLKNYPDAYVFMLLVDERPEEVTDMERQVKGPHCEVISSTFDEPASRHIQVSEMVLDKAKRMVEYGKDVIIFLDSITRLARAWNNECPTSGKTLSGGVDAGALQPPKKFFGSARKVEEGGSLTIIATALVDTGSRMDEVIFEEFKGTGNLEIWLDRTLVDKRIWPAIDISRSGTRREEMILDPEEHKRISVLRRLLNEMNPPDAMEFLTQKLAKTQNNAEFLMGLNIRQ